MRNPVKASPSGTIRVTGPGQNAAAQRFAVSGKAGNAASAATALSQGVRVMRVDEGTRVVCVALAPHAEEEPLEEAPEL